MSSLDLLWLTFIMFRLSPPARQGILAARWPGRLRSMEKHIGSRSISLADSTGGQLR